LKYLLCKKEIKIWYDKEGDFLEVLFDIKPGFFKDTDDDAIMEKVDNEGNILGFSSGLYAPVSRSIDFYLNLHFSGVSDSREIQRYDIYGNSVTLGKVNRVYMMPLSIGLNKELFKGDIEGNFRPSISFGVAPTLVMYNPYDRSFFNAIAYTKTKFAFGPYAGIGINYKQSKSTSLNINLSYYYLPVSGGGVESIENSEIKDVGGLQLTFGLNFMK